MNKYSTYQEAKIDNPESEIYHFKHKNADTDSFFFTVDDERELVAINGTIFKCKPSVYCMTLADFFDAGHSLAERDVHTGIFGDVYTVGLNEAMEDANRRIGTDDRCYILRAKALEKKEWKNGDECRYINDLSHEYVYIGAHPHGDGHFVFSEGKGITYIANGYIIKPETESQRLDRQRLKSAYHLACIAGVSNIWGNDITFDDFKQDESAVKRWLAVVDETKYMKGR